VVVFIGDCQLLSCLWSSGLVGLCHCCVFSALSEWFERGGFPFVILSVQAGAASRWRAGESGPGCESGCAASQAASLRVIRVCYWYDMTASVQPLLSVPVAGAPVRASSRRMQGMQGGPCSVRSSARFSQQGKRISSHVWAFQEQCTSHQGVGRWSSVPDELDPIVQPH